MLGAVERDFVPSIDVHPRVTFDHEHQPELGCSGLDPHHLFPSFDLYCVVYALTRDCRERVLFLSVYLAYKEDSSEKKSKKIKHSKIKKISTKL